MKRRDCLAAMTAALSGVVTGAVWAQGGPPPGGPGRPPGMGGGGMMGGMGGGMRRFGPYGMFQMPEVQKELKLSAKQIKDIEALQPPGGGMMGGMGRPGGPGGGPGGGRPPGGGGPGGGPGRSPGGGGGDFEKRMREMRDKMEKDLGKILDKKQMDRFHQLQIQQAGARALDDERVAAKLNLTADQKKKINAIRDAERDEMRKMFQGMGGPGGGPGGPGRPPGGPGGGPGGPGSAGRPPGGPGGGPGGGMGGFGRMREMREKNGQKMLAVLTGPQKKQFEALKGKPFKFPEMRFGPGAPGGGRPGGPSRT